MSAETDRARKRALNALNARAMSRGELRERLVRLGESEELAAETADWCVEIGYVDDAEYARGLVRSLTRRGYGNRRIRDEFFRRKIPRELWDDILEETSEDGEDDASSGAVTFLERRLRGTVPDRDEKRRVMAALSRRGFSWDEINAAYNRYLEMAEDND